MSSQEEEVETVYVQKNVEVLFAAMYGDLKKLRSLLSGKAKPSWTALRNEAR